MLCNNGNIVYVYDNKMTAEIWRVHILWIFQITKITRDKSPIQNCLSGDFHERMGIIAKNLKCYNCKTLNLDRKRDACGFCISKTN